MLGAAAQYMHKGSCLKHRQHIKFGKAYDAQRTKLSVELLHFEEEKDHRAHGNALSKCLTEFIKLYYQYVYINNMANCNLKEITHTDNPAVLCSSPQLHVAC